MTTSLTMSLFEQISPLRLAGPIFDKELRVASRQRRFYALRCAYIGLLMIVMVYFWLVVVHSRSAGSALIQVSRMAEAGKYIVVTIVWFQFIVAQFLAVTLLSGAISDEIHRRTLDVLLTTPVSSIQIVWGKLLSKLLQLVLLLAISLPLLAIVRVFGGVPWDYVVFGLSITLTTALFVGSLSLLLSAMGGRFRQVTVSVVAWCLLLWLGGGAIVLGLAQTGHLSRAHAKDVLYLTNPFVIMTVHTRAMLTGSAMGGALVSWLLHCAIVLGATVVLLLLAVWRVRKITITSIVTHAEGRRKGAKGPTMSAVGWWPWHRKARPIKGSPIVWKEQHRPWFRHGRRSAIYGSIALVLVVGTLVWMALAGASPYILFYLPIQVLQVAFIISLAAGAASAITREKEARTWPILLTTPLTEREIVRGKASGILRRCLWLLAPLPLLYLFFGFSTPRGDATFVSLIVSTMAIVTWLAGAVVFLLGLGLYFSVRLKTTTAAVATTLGIYFGLKLFCCGGFAPLFLLSSHAMGPGGPSSLMGVLMPLLMSLGPTIINAGAGLLFFRLATRRLRRDVFA